jgi:hypothetical protein
MSLNAESLINSLKGVQGTGRLLGVLAQFVKDTSTASTLEPGDIVLSGRHPVSMSAPLAYDLWYLWNAVNLVHHINPGTDSEVYVDENLKFLKDKLMGLKPMKALTLDTLKSYAVETGQLAPSGSKTFRVIKDNWANEGAYFIQVLAYELCQRGTVIQFDSDGPKNFERDNYVGYAAFPAGQLGIMEVISYFQESETDPADYTLEDTEKPVIIPEPSIFPPMEFAGENRSLGAYIIESSYLVPINQVDRVEIMSTGWIPPTEYTQDVAPKTWTRIWIKRTDTFPVPGELLAILCKPLACPPHTWWMQESTPFLYAGNWMETQNLTSGIITMVTLETARTDHGIGDEYWVRINGTEIIAYASDFKRYEVNDRVAILKRWTTSSKTNKSFTWINQRNGTHPVKNQVSLEFVILPITFYKQT